MFNVRQFVNNRVEVVVCAYVCTKKLVFALVLRSTLGQGSCKHPSRSEPTGPAQG